ncbi:MAG: hypothetical protein NZ761_07440, partial [Dehalococcoidia bacterium]|nr:hypothetical protein [Dehalococcoidia bacterium]
MRLVVPSPRALATEVEVQRVVWKVTEVVPHPTGHTEEEQDILCGILNAVSDAVDRILGGSALEQVRTERYDGGWRWILLRAAPVWEVLEVKEGGVPLPPTAYLVYRDEAALRRRNGTFSGGPQGVEVTYRAGWATQVRDAQNALVAVTYRPGGEGIRHAVLLWCKALWDVGPALYTYQISETGVLLSRNAEIPPAVAAILAQYRRPQSVL